MAKKPTGAFVPAIEEATFSVPFKKRLTGHKTAATFPLPLSLSKQVIHWQRQRQRQHRQHRQHSITDSERNPRRSETPNNRHNRDANGNRKPRDRPCARPTQDRRSQQSATTAVCIARTQEEFKLIASAAPHTVTPLDFLPGMDCSLCEAAFPGPPLGGN